MALINRPLTEDEARQLVADWRKGWPLIPSFYDLLAEALREPTPHVVRYRADEGVRYSPPTEFYISRRRRTLSSDCVWIVPSTLEKGDLR